jgi:uncharacterized Zn finger protein
MITKICSECGHIIKEDKCKTHPNVKLIVYKSERESFVGEAIMDYLYHDCT